MKPQSGIGGCGFRVLNFCHPGPGQDLVHSFTRKTFATERAKHGEGQSICTRFCSEREMNIWPVNEKNHLPIFGPFLASRISFTHWTPNYKLYKLYKSILRAVIEIVLILSNPMIVIGNFSDGCLNRFLSDLSNYDCRRGNTARRAGQSNRENQQPVPR